MCNLLQNWHTTAERQTIPINTEVPSSDVGLAAITTLNVRDSNNYYCCEVVVKIIQEVTYISCSDQLFWSWKYKIQEI